MLFSMNGFRKSLSSDTKKLADIIDLVVKGDFYEDDDLVQAMNEVINHSNVLNWVYSKDDPNFTDMSDIKIDHLELLD